MSKTKLTPSERSIIRQLIFSESFAHIQTETGLSYGAIRDDLIKLINHGFIQVMNDNLTGSSSFFDSDHIEQFSFQATKIGLKQIQNHEI